MSCSFFLDLQGPKELNTKSKMLCCLWVVQHCCQSKRDSAFRDILSIILQKPSTQAHPLLHWLPEIVFCKEKVIVSIQCVSFLASVFEKRFEKPIQCCFSESHGQRVSTGLRTETVQMCMEGNHVCWPVIRNWY